MSGTRLGVLVADIGKTRCRLQLRDADGLVQWAADSDGVAGLAATGADEVAERLIALAAAHATADIDAVAVGAAGALAAFDVAAALADRLAQAFGSCAVVTSDIVTAHLGAFAGQAGTVLVAGTGAVAMGIAADGATTLVDGRGPEVGDLGGGAWIGRAGITAAVRSTDGVEPPTELRPALAGLLGPSHDLQAWLSAGGNVGGRLGAFAPAVLDAAERGDPAAAAITAAAVRHLTATAVTAGEDRVAVLGGLLDHAAFRRALLESLRGAGLEPVRPIGSALDGALLAAVTSDLLHERHLHRA